MTPPPLPPRKPSSSDREPFPSPNTRDPPPLPPRQTANQDLEVVTSTPGDIGAAAKDYSSARDVDSVKEDAVPQPAVTVEVTPASPTDAFSNTSEEESKNSAQSPQATSGPESPHEAITSPSSSPPDLDAPPLAHDIAKSEPTDHSDSSNPPKTAPPSLERPPLPPRKPTPAPPSPFPIDANPPSTSSSRLSMPWTLVAVALIFVAYTRIVPVWLLVGAIGAAGFLPRRQASKTPTTDSTSPHQPPIPPGVESRVAVDWV